MLKITIRSYISLTYLYKKSKKNLWSSQLVKDVFSMNYIAMDKSNIALWYSALCKEYECKSLGFGGILKLHGKLI